MLIKYFKKLFRSFYDSGTNSKIKINEKVIAIKKSNEGKREVIK